MAVVGDPSFDVANTYHVLKLLRKTSKVDLGEYFVECYGKHSGQKLANLQFYKDMSALKFASWFLLLPFEPNIPSIFTRLVKSLFFIGRVGYSFHKQSLQRSLNRQHSVDQRTIEYFQNYIVQYLEAEAREK